MRKNVLLYGWWAVLCGIFLLPVIAQADVYLKQKHHSDGYKMMGQNIPSKDYEETMWITMNISRSDNKQYSTIVRMDKQQIIMIDHLKKTYTEMPLNIGKAVDDTMGKMSPGKKQAMGGMMQGLKNFSIKVIETGESKKIGKWNCRKYIMKMNSVVGATTTDIWATQDFKINTDLFKKQQALFMTNQSGIRESTDQIMTEMKKVNGMTILTNNSSTMMGTTLKSSVELLEYKEGAAPSDINVIPAGYKKQSMSMR